MDFLTSKMNKYQYMEDSQDEMLSEVERNKNYLNLVNAAKHIENGERITEDWVYEQKRLIEQWREWIPDFSVINQERQDKAFRDKCSKTETLMRYILATGFNIKTYLQLLQHMKNIIDMISDDDEFEGLFENLRM